MKNKELILALFVGINAKDHFVVNEGKANGYDEHKIVKAGEEIERCLFYAPAIDGNGDEDKLCVTYTGSSSVGFKWDQDIQDLDKSSEQGFFQLSLTYYWKADLYAQFQFILNRLLKQEMAIELEETELSHTTAIKYWSYQNDLCIDIYSSISDFLFIIDITMAFLECSKNLIDNFDDFGQFAAWDSTSSNKPIGPYSKFFDDCDLSSETTVQVKEYEPFASDSELGWDNMVRWLGNGSDAVDDECYPKNIIRSIWILEKSLSGAGYDSSEIDEQIVQSKKNGGNFMINYVEPYIQIAIYKAMNMMVESAQQYQPNTDDGRYELIKF